MLNLLPLPPADHVNFHNTFAKRQVAAIRAATSPNTTLTFTSHITPGVFFFHSRSRSVIVGYGNLQKTFLPSSGMGGPYLAVLDFPMAMPDDNGWAGLNETIAQALALSVSGVPLFSAPTCHHVIENKDNTDNVRKTYIDVF